MLKKKFSFQPKILYVNPHSINQHALEPNLTWVVWSAVHLPKYVNQKLVFRLKYILGRKGVFGGNWDINSKPFIEREEFRLMNDLKNSLPNFRQSIWYKHGVLAIEKTGRFTHKNLIAFDLLQLDQIFEEYLVQMLLSMKRYGYRQGEGVDFPEGMIGRDGTLIKTAHGTHRLAAAKVSGAQGLFPIKVIGIHRLWLSALLESLEDDPSNVVARSLADIEARYRSCDESSTGSAVVDKVRNAVTM